MNTPTMKRKLGIIFQDAHQRVILFQADESLTDSLKQFGAITAASGYLSVTSLEVDARYDFDEVLAYVESLA